MAEIGTLVHKTQVESGVSKKTQKPWTKIEFVIKARGAYPRHVAFTVFNKQELIDMVSNTSIGTELMVEHFPAESREYEGRWYTNHQNATSVEVYRESEDITQAPDHKGVNQAAQMYNSEYERKQNQPVEGGDDLPF